MRSDFAVGESALIATGEWDEHWQVLVSNGDDTDVDISTRLISGSVSLPDPDAPIGKASLTLIREANDDEQWSLAPLVDASSYNRLNDAVTISPLLQIGRRLTIRLALTARGAARPDEGDILVEVYGPGQIDCVARDAGGSGEPWATLRSGNGTYITTAPDPRYSQVSTTGVATTDYYRRIQRAIMFVPTSGHFTVGTIPQPGTYFELPVQRFGDAFGDGATLMMTGMTPTVPGAINAADYQGASDTLYSDTQFAATPIPSPTGYETARFYLNAAGRAALSTAIDAGAPFHFMLRVSYDALNSPPTTWATNKDTKWRSDTLHAPWPHKLSARNLDTTGLSDKWHDVFNGYVKQVNWPERYGDVSVEGLDLAYPLMRTFVETPNTYVTSTTIEATIQAILDEVMGSGLYPLTVDDVAAGGTTGSALSVDYQPNIEPVWTAIQNLAASIGWVLWFRYNGSGVPVLTLTEPRRNKITADYTFTNAQLEDVKSLTVIEDDIRNVVVVNYVDSDLVQQVSSTTDPTSIAKYGGIRRYIAISEDETSPIRNATAADALRNAILSDLKDPDADMSVRTLGAWWPAEPSVDLYTFPTNTFMFDNAQSLAPYSAKIEFQQGELASSSIAVRGKPSGGSGRWLGRREGVPPVSPVTGRMWVTVDTAAKTLDLYAQLDGAADYFPATLTIYLGDPDSSEILVHQFDDPGERIGPTGSGEATEYAELNDFALPKKGMLSFFGLITDAAGVTRWLFTAGDLDSDPGGTVTADDFKTYPALVCRYDDDVAEIKVVTPSGTKTYSGLSGGGQVTYTVGDALDAGSELAMAAWEERDYTVTYYGAASALGPSLVAWDGPLHGKRTPLAGRIWVDVNIATESLDLYAVVNGADALFPVSFTLYQGTPTGTLQTHSFTFSLEEIGPTGGGSDTEYAALNDIALPKKGTVSFWGKAVDAQGQETWFYTAGDLDSDPGGSTTSNDYRSAPALITRYDDDVVKIIVVTPSGNKTYSGLSGGGQVTYTVGDALDSGSETLLTSGETRTGYRVTLYGAASGGPALETWDGPLHGELASAAIPGLVIEEETEVAAYSELIPSNNIQSVGRNADEAWATIRAGAGNYSTSGVVTAKYAQIYCSSTTDQYTTIKRVIAQFPMWGIPGLDASTTVEAGTKVYLEISNVNDTIGSATLMLTEGAAGPTIGSEDYNNCTDVLFSDDAPALANGTLSWTLNEAGIANLQNAIETSGASFQVGVRIGFDALNTEPTWGSGLNAGCRVLYNHANSGVLLVGSVPQARIILRHSDPEALTQEIQYRTKVGSADWPSNWLVLLDNYSVAVPTGVLTSYPIDVVISESPQSWVQARLLYNPSGESGGEIYSSPITSSGLDQGKLPNCPIKLFADRDWNVYCRVDGDYDTKSVKLAVNVGAGATDPTKSEARLGTTINGRVLSYDDVAFAHADFPVALLAGETAAAGCLGYTGLSGTGSESTNLYSDRLTRPIDGSDPYAVLILTADAYYEDGGEGFDIDVTTSWTTQNVTDAGYNMSVRVEQVSLGLDDTSTETDPDTTESMVTTFAGEGGIPDSTKFKVTVTLLDSSGGQVDQKIVYALILPA